ncbi:MAG: glycosyltransferase family 2 protein [Chloroflexi bacterium]|nr:glycosyltransferase family 2 protein [Chloroflexota bacterium]
MGRWQRGHGARGFPGGATDRGIAVARGDFLLLLNPDTEIIAGALQAMAAYLRAHAAMGVVGPQLLNRDGTVQSSRRRFPTLPTALLESTLLQRWFPHSRVLTRYTVDDQSDAVTQEVDWLTGACLLARRGQEQ